MWLGREEKGGDLRLRGVSLFPEFPSFRVGKAENSMSSCHKAEGMNRRTAGPQLIQILAPAP